MQLGAIWRPAPTSPNSGACSRSADAESPGGSGRTPLAEAADAAADDDHVNVVV